MYSIVMLTAMTAGADGQPVPQPAPVARSYGCGGGCYGSCYGSCNGCYGSCHGGLFHGHKHGLFGHHRASCHGCSGYSCNGWNCFGSCSGCTGAGGSCFGGSCYGTGMMQSASRPAYGYGWGPTLNYSDPFAVYGVVTHTPPMVVLGDVTTTGPKPMEKPMEPKKEGMSANLKFRLPTDAKLYVDGRLTLVNGTERSFVTPPLLPGHKFYYDVKAEVVVDGKVLVEEKRIIVEAGANITDSFPVLLAAVEGRTIPVAGK